MNRKRFGLLLCIAALWSAACDAPATSTTDTDSDTPVDCLVDYDANAPALRFRAIVPTEPAPLADIAAGTQSSVDDETLNYLLSMTDVSSGGTVVGFFGVGEPTGVDDTFQFTDETEVSFDISGNSFTSSGDVSMALVVPLTEGEVLSVPLQEVSITGEFSTSLHCAVGAQIEEEPPTEWEPGGEISGLLSVDDARAISVTVASRTFTLCAYLAYGVAAAVPNSDAECAMDLSEWTYPPEETTAGGADAWRVSADFAATGIYLD